MALLRMWVSAVQSHTPGEKDEAARLIAGWSSDDAEWVERYIQTLIEFMVDEKRVAPSQPLQRMNADLKEIREIARYARSPVSVSDFPKRAALLHSDIVMFVGWVAARFTPLPGGSRPARADSGTAQVRVLGPDGRFDGYQVANPHWDIARAALRPLPPDDGIRLWYHVVASYFAGSYAIADFASHLEYGLRSMPDDPWLLFDSGCLQETLAAPMTQDFVSQTTLAVGFRFEGMSAPVVHFQRAESLLRRALASRPVFPEAQLRLGRVLGRLNRHADAIAELDRVDRDTSSPSHKYFVNLFRGDSERALARRDRARVNYETAVALYPQSQAARVALSHLLRETGGREEALAALEPAIAATGPRTPQEDPWWDYYRCDGPYIEQLFDQLVEPYLKKPVH
jgi:tetratricopeptide (TPR) repeat protein